MATRRPANGKELTVAMVINRSKTTKNTYRYEAVEDSAPISTLYIRQGAVDAAGLGDSITVVVK